MNPVTQAQVRALAFGGGVRLFWTNPSDTDFDHVKILRKLTNDISGPSDPAATVVYSGPGQQVPAGPINLVINPSPAGPSALNRAVLDESDVTYATTFSYAIYAANAGETDMSTAVMLTVTTPDVSVFEEPDLIAGVLSYLTAYFQRQVATGGLLLRPGQTGVEIHDAPPLLETVQLPCLSVHLDAEEAQQFALGDRISRLDESGDTVVYRRGYTVDQTLRIVVWTDNPELRRSLYRMLMSAVIAARPLLAYLGATNLKISGRYEEDFTGYNLPLYLGVVTLTATLVASVRAVPVEPILTEIDVNPPAVSLTPV